jgi:outer membrane protein OmpA-like peptidoglycan-associated protein
MRAHQTPRVGPGRPSPIAGSTWPILLVFLFAPLTQGCSSWGNTAKGAAVGAAIGGAAGAVVGNETGSTARGVLIGAAVGGAAGAIIGSQMDDTAEKLDKSLEGATVERVGEGILVTFDSGILFDFDSAALRPMAQTQLTDLSEALLEVDKTDVVIVGHTDSQGTESYNQTLSERRARSAASHLMGNGVTGDRIIVEGRGEMEPISTNETDAGRQENRRIEVAIYASEEYQEEARRQAARGN